MSNSRNKILVFAQSAIEGQNIQSQAEYEGSSEREDGVSTGIANGDNFNKLAKQVSTMSSSIAEFIVNNTEDVIIQDTNSVEQISGYINQAVIKLITENLPPKEPGINVIDESSEIVDFNQLTETGVYYIYKDLLNKPYSDKTTYVLTVLNFIRQGGIPTCIQLSSSYLRSNGYMIPAIVNDEYSIRYENKGLFSPWEKLVALDLSTNKAVAVSMEAFADNEISKYMVMSTDKEGNSIFKTASRELMRSALGINALGDKVDLQTDVENVLGVKNGGTGRIDGLGFKNGIAANDLWNLLELSKPCTTQEFCDAFRNYCDNPENNTPIPVGILNCAVYTDLLSDLPKEINASNVHQLQIKYIDLNQFEMQLVAPYGKYSLYGGGISGGVFKGWKKLRNADGSVPAELVNVIDLPIGFIYIQLRGQFPPDELFGSSGKWQDISSIYAGEFFRAVGGNSNDFGVKQNEGLPQDLT